MDNLRKIMAANGEKGIKLGGICRMTDGLEDQAGNFVVPLDHTKSYNFGALTSEEEKVKALKFVEEIRIIGQIKKQIELYKSSRGGIKMENVRLKEEVLKTIINAELRVKGAKPGVQLTEADRKVGEALDLSDEDFREFENADLD